MSNREEYFKSTLAALRSQPVARWQEITSIIASLSSSSPNTPEYTPKDIFVDAARGLAFITFEYGIDGVSIEIAKYARALQDALQDSSPARIHLIAGDFHPLIDRLFKPDLPRFHLHGANGWSKWDDGKWFSGLFYEDMPGDSSISNELCAEIFAQALTIAEQLGNYILENDISLLIPVNIASNPGNLALTLALVIVSETLALPVINSNHDFYWESGRPSGESPTSSPPGVRDHFFRNMENEPFFDLFQSLYPWNGNRWLQVNINSRQSSHLIEHFAFSPAQVSELPTSVPDALFAPFKFEHIRSARERMARILSNGRTSLQTVSLGDHLNRLEDWMADQQPLAIGAESGLVIDPTSPNLIYLLQPTRLVARKRIPRDIELIRALLSNGPLKAAFDSQPDRQLVLHITGPVPVEHQEDLEDVLQAFHQLLSSLPPSIARRVFLAFSVGREDHPSFESHGLSPLNIVDIFRMASLILFPSQTEGRGLPIIESAAVGVPIVCSRYTPESVFAEVVGEHLPPEYQIRYTLFPDGEFTPSFLERVTALLLDPAQFQSDRAHNQNAVRARFSLSSLTSVWRALLEKSSLMP